MPGLHFHDSMLDESAFRLRAAMMIYMGETGALVTGHDVMFGEDGKPRLTAGYPLTRELVDLLVRGIQGGSPTNVILPPNVIMSSGLRLAWWAPSKRRRIWFHPKDQPKLQHISRREVMHPPLLFVADPGRLNAYALARSERPAAETPLFQAPYLNVYDHGWVCGETVSWPESAAVEHIPQWEAGFFDSEGTEVWAQRLTLHPGGHDALWEDMLTAEEFPAASLVPTGLTVLDAVNRQGPTPMYRPPTEEVIPRAVLSELATRSLEAVL